MEQRHGAGFNSKHIREMKDAEEKWILNKDAEPHRLNFRFFLVGFVWNFSFKKKPTVNRINNLFTFKSATRPPTTQT